MQRIIDGYIYDTDTAELIYQDLAKMRLYYMTPNKRFFAYFSNNAIETVTESYIKNLLGTYDIAKYIEIFGEPEEG